MSDRRRTILRTRKIRTPLAREVLIFLVFIIISTFFWFLYALSKPITTTVDLKIEYLNAPTQYILTKSLPQELTVKIQDVGINILLYYLGHPNVNLKFDLSSGFNEEEIPFYITSAIIKKAIKKKLSSSVNILSYNPGNIYVSYSKLYHKRLPVRLLGSIKLFQQYTFMDDIGIEPNIIDVYGSKDILDTMVVVNTKPLFLSDLTETVVRDIAIESNELIRTDVKSVKITVPVEQFTEKTIPVTVKPINFPKNIQLRTFPAVVNVEFFVGLSHFEEISDKHIDATVDYNNLIGDKQGKTKVNIKTRSKYISNLRLSTEYVEYILEESN